ncbi:MAG: Rpn family recombination-promoting nuclease/putative transposase, partial [Planctomycetota bacterium]|nr:Rpn family recombination-promoting nuclease/putative transposase [Planctomycetota bacterium]
MTATPHDAFFKAVFSRPENALGELKAVLPPALVAALEPGSVRLMPRELRRRAARFSSYGPPLLGPARRARGARSTSSSSEDRTIGEGVRAMFMSRGEVNLSARAGLRGVAIDVYLLIREEALPPMDEL